jgi:uncharacterized membrane protein
MTEAERPPDDGAAPGTEPGGTDAPPTAPAPALGSDAPDEGPKRLGWLEHKLLDPGVGAARSIGGHVLPAWRRVTKREPRVPVTIAIVVAIGLMAALPDRVANRPRWLVPALAGLLLIGILVANTRVLDRRSRSLRVASLVLIAVLSIANAASGIRLVVDLVESRGIKDPAGLLLTGAAIWITNMIVFGLWYWEFDRGGPAARAQGIHEFPDFLFPQMTSPELAPPDWEPQFVDYLYVSFTNATAFSPTDTMPMSRWTKLTMLAQSVLSLVIVVLVVARAVNILH